MRTVRLIAALVLLSTMRLAAQGVLSPSLLRQSGATDGQVLCWSDANSRWQPCADQTGGSPAFNTITGGTNTGAAMIVGTGASLTTSGSGTITATSAATATTASTATALAANGGNCSAGQAAAGVDASGAAEGCAALSADDLADNTLSDLSDVTAKSGNTTVVATTSGTLTSGDCVEFDASGNLVAAGAACGSGSGSSINVEENNVEVVAAADLTGIDFLGADFDVTNSTNEADVAIAAAITRDAEWDTIAEIETATGVNIIVATEIDTEAELEALLGDVTNVFTNNDGALADDDLSDNAITDLSDVAAKSGNTTTVATTSGTLTSGDCVEFDANGNLVASGAACGSGGGSPGGSDTQVQYNSSGSFAGDSGFTYDGTGTLFVQDVTPSTGVTNVTFQGGAGQGTTNDVLTLKTAAGSDFVKFTPGNIFFDATVNFASTSASSERVAIASGVYIASSFPIRWSASSDASGTADVGLERLAAGVLEVTNGSTGVGKLATGSIDVEDNGTRPTCDSSIRGTIWDDEGGAGVADDFSACVKSAADTYAWSSLIGAGGGASALDDLTDVTITTVGSGDLLRYNGSAWVNTTLGTGDLPSGATLDTEWDTAAEINAATTDDDFVTLTGAETLSSGTKTLTAKLDAGGGTIEIPNSTSLPGTCAVGDAYMDTDATSGQRFYLCESANTWALQGDGGPADTDGLPEGSTNLYYTDARARSGVIAAAIQGASSTNMILQAGGSQSGDLLALKNAAGSTLSRFDIEGSLDISSNAKFYIGGGYFVRWQGGTLNLSDSHHVRWSSGAASGPHDVGLSRASAGLLRVTNGATTTTNGALEAADLTVYDNTATTGVTTAVVKAGAGQSATDLTQWQDNAGAVLGRITSDGYGKLPAVQLVDPGTKPSCTSDTRGMIWYDAGGAGVADTAEICGKDAADAYAWVAIATF